MKLYFQGGRQRIAVDTEAKTYSRNYCYLGGFREYIKTNAQGIREILAECIYEGYIDKDAEF